MEKQKPRTAKNKLLSLCEGGNVRSVACAYLLKTKYGCDAIAASWHYNSRETLALLFKWADNIVIMQPQFKDYVPDKFHDKIVVVDVGPDIWGDPAHPDLIKKCDAILWEYAKLDKAKPGLAATGPG